ncbi:MAG: T9SS type A sorting domain-containing protein [bacterium]|nr:T9SS type A sorting domain-containing protein [bacterium]
MKKYYITSLIMALASFSMAQVTFFTPLDENNVNATFTDDGYFLTNTQTTSPGYEVPKGSGNHAIFTGSFWIGGTDVNGQLKMAAQQYHSTGNDYYKGPLWRYEANTDSTVENYFGQTIWKVSRAEIDDHIANYQSSTYTMPNDIANWPAQGDTSLGPQGTGMLAYIAPFVDVNNNGQYDPQNGDYPCIKGDLATYTILNDKGGLHFGSGGEPIGVELHCMFYQYSSVPGLEDVTFMDIEVLNMGTQTLFDTRAGFFLDTDLGNYQDDYIGTDTLRNMVYAYNADDFDEANGGAPGYGSAPPAVGLQLLSHDLHASVSFTNMATFPYNDPSVSPEFYQIMDGNYRDGSDQLDGQGNPTNFTYYGDPNDVNDWSEFQLANSPGDRRFVSSLDLGVLTPDMTYGAVNRQTVTYAIVYAKGTDHLNSIAELQTTADFVQSHYDNMTSNCFDLQLASIEEQQELEFSIYPNPNSGLFTVDLPQDQKDATLEIVDAQGRKVHSRTIFSGSNTIDVALESGVYFITVTNSLGSGLQRLVVR